eukprot:GHVT01078390.1.p1 GENE.GHVT01078390.1~~GHVT01078390.1.p1  ORF type:complete len:1058 (+),score=84.48 GHVT01078390.1:257-3430(+)
MDPSENGLLVHRYPTGVTEKASTVPSDRAECVSRRVSSAWSPLRNTDDIQVVKNVAQRELVSCVTPGSYARSNYPEVYVRGNGVDEGAKESFDVSKSPIEDITPGTTAFSRASSATAFLPSHEEERSTCRSFNSDAPTHDRSSTDSYGGEDSLVCMALGGDATVEYRLSKGNPETLPPLTPDDLPNETLHALQELLRCELVESAPNTHYSSPAECGTGTDFGLAEPEPGSPILLPIEALPPASQHPQPSTVVGYTTQSSVDHIKTNQDAHSAVHPALMPMWIPSKHPDNSPEIRTPSRTNSELSNFSEVEFSRGPAPESNSSDVPGASSVFPARLSNGSLAGTLCTLMDHRLMPLSSELRDAHYTFADTRKLVQHSGGALSEGLQSKIDQIHLQLRSLAVNQARFIDCMRSLIEELGLGENSAKHQRVQVALKKELIAAAEGRLTKAFPKLRMDVLHTDHLKHITEPKPVPGPLPSGRLSPSTSALYLGTPDAHSSVNGLPVQLTTHGSVVADDSKNSLYGQVDVKCEALVSAYQEDGLFTPGRRPRSDAEGDFGGYKRVCRSPSNDVSPTMSSSPSSSTHSGYSPSSRVSPLEWWRDGEWKTVLDAMERVHKQCLAEGGLTDDMEDGELRQLFHGVVLQEAATTLGVSYYLVEQHLRELLTDEARGGPFTDEVKQQVCEMSRLIGLSTNTFLQSALGDEESSCEPLGSTHYDMYSSGARQRVSHPPDSRTSGRIGVVRRHIPKPRNGVCMIAGKLCWTNRELLTIYEYMRKHPEQGTRAELWNGLSTLLSRSANSIRNKVQKLMKREAQEGPHSDEVRHKICELARAARKNLSWTDDDYRLMRDLLAECSDLPEALTRISRRGHREISQVYAQLCKLLQVAANNNGTHPIRLRQQICEHCQKFLPDLNSDKTSRDPGLHSFGFLPVSKVGFSVPETSKGLSMDENILDGTELGNDILMQPVDGTTPVTHAGDTAQTNQRNVKNETFILSKIIGPELVPDDTSPSCVDNIPPQYLADIPVNKIVSPSNRGDELTQFDSSAGVQTDSSFLSYVHRDYE